MPTAYQLPVRTELAKKVGPKLWWKPILRKGRIEKDGVELDVNDALFDSYIQSFQAGAKDQVQFLAGHADDSNLDAFRGDLRGLEVRDDMLWGLFGVTAKADQMLEENPALGASVSVVDRFERADGRKYGPTLLHVAGTFDPEVGRLGDWVRAELSASKTRVIDLTAPPGAPHTPATPGGSTRQEGPTVPELKTSDEETLAQLRALLPALTKLAALPDDGGDTAEGDDPDAEFTDAELKAMADPAPAETGKSKTANPDPKAVPAPVAEVKAEEPELVAAAADTVEALELANSRIDAQQVELARLRKERDDERWAAEQMSLAKDYAIPAAVSTLAKPLLYGTGHTLELSAGQKVDAGHIVRSVLKEMGTRLMTHLDLGHEYGTQDSEDDTAKRKRENDDFLARAHAELGTKKNQGSAQ